MKFTATLILAALMVGCSAPSGRLKSDGYIGCADRECNQQCPICGAVVHDVNQHVQWHRKHGEAWEPVSR
jgi:hypothetical protein